MSGHSYGASQPNGTSTSAGPTRAGGWPKRSGGNANPARERSIVRMCALKAAVEFCSARPEAKSTDIVKLAAVFEAWINR